MDKIPNSSFKLVCTISPYVKVTLDAVNDCKVLRLSESNVRRAFEDDPDLEFLVDCLVSKDITRKLYVINDNVYSASPGRSDNPMI